MDYDDADEAVDCSAGGGEQLGQGQDAGEVHEVFGGKAQDANAVVVCEF
jgi:hypothetical protein